MQTGYGSLYAELYRRHWWWRAREALLLGMLRRLDLDPQTEILDVGCGDGLFFPELERFGNVRGIEVDRDLLDPEGPYRERISGAPLGDPQYADWRFGLITALDVIEHIEDDRAAVESMAAMLDPGGYLLITVPARMELWDRHDEINHHHRRYRTEEVGELLQPLGEVLELRYWFHTLYVAKRGIAAINRRRDDKISQHTIPPRPINAILRSYCEWEAVLLGPLNLPVGSSVLAVVRKQ